VIVVRTLGARERRRMRGRRPSAVADATEPEPVPTSRITLVRAQPFGSAAEAQEWLVRLRGDRDALDAEIERALVDLNAILRAQRAAAADPYARDVDRATANVVRVGYGSGDQVADGHFEAAYEVPDRPARVKRTVALQPQERLAAILNGSSPVLAAEELVLRARADIAAGRFREAALQARIGLEALLSERPEDAGRLEPHRARIADAANAALKGELPGEQEIAVTDAVDEMRRALLRQ
jgi:hypothetical protein